jgi:hypothetical protein
MLICGFFFFSCIGAGADIQLRRNGSGTIKLEYRMAKDLESLGKLDGNERWPTAPVGRADFERSVNRIQGLKLRSFVTREDGKDLLSSVQLDFDNTGALAAFLDSPGRRLTIDMNAGSIRCIFPPVSSIPPINPNDGEFKELLTEVFAGYDFSLSFTLPGEVRGRWVDGDGKSLDSGPAQLALGENTITISSPMADMVYYSGTAVLEIGW